MKAWDDFEDRRKPEPLKSAVTVWMLLVIFAGCGLVAGYLFGLDRGYSEFAASLDAAKAEMTRLEAIQARENKFQQCTITYVSSFEGSDLQHVQLRCPASLEIERER